MTYKSSNGDHLTYDQLMYYLDNKYTLPVNLTKEILHHLENCSCCWKIWNTVRWDKAKNTQGLQELKEYLGKNFQEYFDSSLALAKEWNDYSPQNEDEIKIFYKHADDYLYNLIIWYESGDRENFKPELEQIAATYGIKSFIDYGCGVGNDGLQLIKDGYKVYFIDFICPSTSFLKWRSKKRSINVEIIDIESTCKLPDADAIFAIDVLEHMSNPLEVLERMNDNTKIFAHRSHFNDRHGGRHPFHLDFDEKLLEKKLIDMGFKKLQSKYLSSWYRRA